MIPEFISNDSTFIDFMYDQTEVFRSLSFSIFVICATLCLTLLKAKKTIPKSENTTFRGKGQEGCCTGCCSNVPFLEWALIITLWLIIITPISGCFYYGGVVVLNLEDTFGGAVILMGFVVSCMLVILFLLGWITFFFCSYTHHFYDDDVNTPETLKGGLRKLRSWKGRLTRQQTMELDKQYVVTTGIDGKPGLVFPRDPKNHDIELGPELRKGHQNNLTMYEDHDYNDHSTQSHQSYSGSVQKPQEVVDFLVNGAQQPNYQPHQNQSRHQQQQQSHHQQQQQIQHQQQQIPHHQQQQQIQHQRSHVQMGLVTSTVSG